MKKTYDMIVAGGGFAGVSAAIEAARSGLEVLLIEKFNCLGGAASNNLVMPFMKYWTKDPATGEKFLLVGDIFCQILWEMEKLGGLKENQTTFDEEILKLVLNRMCTAYGVHLLLNTTVTEATMDGDRIASVTAWGRAKRMVFTGNYFVDATGDGELFTMAGCPYRVGRESDGLCQPMTLCFRMGNVDAQKFQENRHKINPLYQEFQKQGKIKNPREDVLIFRTMHAGVLHFNTTRVIQRDPTDPMDVTQAELLAREQVFEIHRFLKENIPGFEESYVLSTALQIGTRESRMVEGEYTLTKEDLISLARFEDAIAVGNYDIDIHNPQGSGTSHTYFADGEWYQIPYRCLLPKGCSNLLVAGRCISSTHEAQASYRIMPFCSQLGQAAGAAIVVAKKTGSSLYNIDIPKLQALLRSEGFQL